MAGIDAYMNGDFVIPAAVKKKPEAKPEPPKAEPVKAADVPTEGGMPANKGKPSQSAEIPPKAPANKNKQNRHTEAADKLQRFQAPAAKEPAKAKKKPQPKPEKETKPVFGAYQSNEPKVVQTTDDTRGNTVGKTRVVDTRTTTVDLSKYDEKLDKYYTDTPRQYAGNKKKPKKKNPRADKTKDKETLARQRKHRQEMIANAKKEKLNVVVGDEIMVSDLAAQLKVTAAEIVKKLMLLGVMASVNQAVDYDTAFLIVDEMGLPFPKRCLFPSRNSSLRQRQKRMKAPWSAERPSSASWGMSTTAKPLCWTLFEIPT